MTEPVQPEVAQAAAQSIAAQAPVAAPVAQPTPVVAAPVAPAAPVVAPDTSDRTKEQFEKLIESNQKLYEANENLSRELARKAQAAQTFQPIQQPVAPARVPQANDFVETNPETGERYINENKFNSAMQEFAQRTSRAEQAVQSYIQTAEQREIARQNTEAFAAHPDLNPGAKEFDVKLSDMTRAVIYDSLINESRYGGRPLSFKEAADYVKSGRQVAPAAQPAPVAQPTVVQQPSAAQDAKVQASATVSATPQVSTVDTGELETLRQATRLGSDEAIAARLKRINHIAKASEEDA